VQSWFVRLYSWIIALLATFSEFSAGRSVELTEGTLRDLNEWERRKVHRRDPRLHGFESSILTTHGTRLATEITGVLRVLLTLPSGFFLDNFGRMAFLIVGAIGNLSINTGDSLHQQTASPIWR